jgi:hypothetical protein
MLQITLWPSLFKLHIIILYSSTFYKKGHVIRRNLKIPIARVSRFVDWCAVMTLESFSCVINPDNFTVSISFEYELERLVAVINKSISISL